MTTLLISHPACLAHDMGEGHPEQPELLRVIDRAMESEVFQMLARDVAPRAEFSAIARVHPLDYIEAIRAATPTQGHTAIDDETSMSPGSFEAALRSAGGAYSRGRPDIPDLWRQPRTTSSTIRSGRTAFAGGSAKEEEVYAGTHKKAE